LNGSLRVITFVSNRRLVAAITDVAQPGPIFIVRELCTESEGYYWYVAIVFEIDRPAQRVNGSLN